MTWLKRFFKGPKPYEGSSPEFIEHYRDVKAELSKVDSDMDLVFTKCELLGIYMYTQGDGRLLKEVNAIIASKIRTKFVNLGMNDEI